MRVKCCREKNLSYIVIDDYFTPDELMEIRQELWDIKRLAVPSDLENSAVKDGKPLRSGTCTFVDNLYRLRKNSFLLTANRKLFSKELVDELVEFDAAFTLLRTANSDYTIVNYYHPEEDYLPHTDKTRITAISLFGYGDFEGGGLVFPEQNVTVGFCENRTVIFISAVLHGSVPIKGSSDSFRVSAANFVGHIEDINR